MAASAPHSIGSDSEAAKGKDERRVNSEDVGLYRPDSSLDHDAMGGKPTSPQHRNGEAVSSGNTPRKASKVSGGFDRSVEHSPLHPHYQAKSAGKSGMSPSWERRASSEGIHGHAPNTPGRSRLRTAGHGDETLEKSSAVPKFGEWDENNPSSGDGFTHIFNEVRKEKQGSSAKVPIITDDSTYLHSYGQDSSLPSTSCGCFRWCRK